MTPLWRQRRHFIFTAFAAAFITNVEAATPTKPVPIPAPSSTKLLTNANYAAQTQQPTLKSGAVFAGGITWQCQGNHCQASGAAATPTVPACHALAIQVGTLSSFAIGNQQLDAGNLALTDTLDKFVDGVPAGDRITIRHLLAP